MAKAANVVLESGTGKNKSTSPVSAAISKLALEACDLKDRITKDGERLKVINQAFIDAYKPAKDDVRMEGVVIVVSERYRIAVSESESRTVEDMDKLVKALGSRAEDLTEKKETITALKKLWEVAIDPDHALYKKVKDLVQFAYSYSVSYRANNK